MDELQRASCKRPGIAFLSKLRNETGHMWKIAVLGRGITCGEVCSNRKRPPPRSLKGRRPPEARPGPRRTTPRPGWESAYLAPDRESHQDRVQSSHVIPENDQKTVAACNWLWLTVTEGKTNCRHTTVQYRPISYTHVRSDDNHP